MKIIITGGCGYVGTELTKFLIKKGHKIKVIDAQWFGNYHQKHKNLILVKKVARKIPSKIIIKKIIDPRNYYQDSSKLLKLGFKPKYNINDSIDDLKKKFYENKLKEKLNFYSMKQIKKLRIK